MLRPSTTDAPSRPIERRSKVIEMQPQCIGGHLTTIGAGPPTGTRWRSMSYHTGHRQLRQSATAGRMALPPPGANLWVATHRVATDPRVFISGVRGQERAPDASRGPHGSVLHRGDPAAEVIPSDESPGCGPARLQ